ncbi:CAP domain-containing protein [Demequina iriomotensis]|uniref:CAP domain-containing protein n=1 Tax=Demequina iriomotensis TaxID=1536641 RepID=UPI000780FE61|nr:CAP domain-containing protein [Demequina iriomotensis]
MTETQDVLEHTRRRRRHAPAILLGGLPVVIASTALVGAYTFVPASASYAQEAIEAPVLDTVTVPALDAITADDAVAAPRVHTVKVTKPKPKPTPAPVATPASSGATTAAPASTPSTGSTASTGSTGAPAASAPATVDFAAYCANPQAPSGASSVSGLLSAANAERAKAGIAPLIWSSALASAATSWSQSMAAKDSSTEALADALAHNPSRPGAENVGVTYRSTGISESAAMNKLHVNWVYSYGHCTNLMNPAYTQFGAGSAVTSDGTTWYATENFR